MLYYVKVFHKMIDLFCKFCYNNPNFNKKFCKIGYLAAESVLSTTRAQRSRNQEFSS